MATKVYEDGWIIVEQGSIVNRINVNNFNYSFNGGNTVLIDEVTGYTFQDETTNIQNKLGVAIGSEADIRAYFTGLKKPQIPLETSISLSYGGNSINKLTVSSDVDGKTIPANSFGDVTIFATNNDVQYRLDGVESFAPNKQYPRTKKDNTSPLLVNVNLDLFIIQGISGTSLYALTINIYK